MGTDETGTREHSNANFYNHYYHYYYCCYYYCLLLTFFGTPCKNLHQIGLKGGQSNAIDKHALLNLNAITACFCFKDCFWQTWHYWCKVQAER